MATGMNVPLYTTDILRLATSLPEPTELERVDARSEQRSPTCGSRVLLDVQVGADGRVAALSQEVHACAFGQASAALMARHAVGNSLAEAEAALDALEGWLGGARADPGDWPGLAALAPARSRKSRHGAILLPFRALAAALRSAQ